jgi:hypothetical protein
MKRRHLLPLFLFLAAFRLRAQPSPAANAAFDAYAASVESRLDRQHRSPHDFLASVGDAVERLTPAAGQPLPGALLHHWRATAFAAGATPASFERLMRDFPAYPRYFAPEVLRAAILQQQPDRLQAEMRVRQHHVLTVVMDTTYDIAFGRLDAQHGYSVSRSTRIDEIDAAGIPLSPADAHGFLWRQNTYWSYEQRDGGLYLQVESLSLSRSIPRGLAWAVRPFVESIPRESLEFTLRATCNALAQPKGL